MYIVKDSYNFYLSEKNGFVRSIFSAKEFPTVIEALDYYEDNFKSKISVIPHKIGIYEIGVDLQSIYDCVSKE